MRRFLLLLVAVCLLSAQTMKLSVGQLKQFLRSSIRLQHDDKKIADYLKKVQLTERFTTRDLEELLGEGLGPKSSEILRGLVTATSELPKPTNDPVAKPVAATIPPPSSEEQKRIIAEAREISLNYTKRLPDFICLQVTRRWFDPSGLEMFHLADTIATRLSYFDQKEDYKVISVNNQVVNTSLDALGGATSTGEFGTLLREVFEPGTQAEFWWERWAKLRGRLVHVFGYRVQQNRSKWHLVWNKQLDIVPGYKGLVYIDKDVPTVMRITLDAENIPPSFPVQEARTTLDYDYTEISGSPFLLPLRAEVRMREGKFLVRNQAEFRNYRKFGAEATITFDVDAQAPLSEEKLQEKPPE
jgi:hypothetical protein